MNSIDLVKMGFKNMWRRKLRTILTVLGVLIGTASIVVMLSLGIGMNESFKKQLSRMGSLNVINVDINIMPHRPDSGGGGMVVHSSGFMRGRSSSNKKIDDKALAAISQLEGVEAVTPLLRTHLMLVSGKLMAHVSLVGIDPDTLEAFDYKVEKGSLIEGDSNGILFGSYIARSFYNPRSRMMYMYGPMGEQEPLVDLLNDRIVMTFDSSYGYRRSTSSENYRRPRLYNVTTAGILEEGRNEKDYSAYISINELKKMLQQKKRDERNNTGRSPASSLLDGYERAMVKVKDIKDVEDVQNAITEMGYGSRSLADMLESMKKQSRTIQLILGGIGAVSLFVAALGITNTMIMSIYERTREIGIMKVLGCMLGNIRKLFLFEAGMIGAFGGVIGLLFSLGASLLLNSVSTGLMGRGMPGDEPTQISIIPVWLAAASIGFAILVGIIAGFYPARRAMKLSALEAIKTD